jgi:hypothetical protein
VRLRRRCLCLRQMHDDLERPIYGQLPRPLTMNSSASLSRSFSRNGNGSSESKSCESTLGRGSGGAALRNRAVGAVRPDLLAGVGEIAQRPASDCHARPRPSHPICGISLCALSTPRWLKASAAARLLRAYVGQVEVLRRLRNGGSQFVRVEHVHVNEGACVASAP